MIQVPNILVHIGYPKTATSWLQKQIFATNSDCFLDISDNCDVPSSWGQMFLRDHNGDDLDSSFMNEEMIESSFARIINGRDLSNVQCVVSHEGLSGAFNRGGGNMESVANRICHNLPNAKILIVIREQCSLIRSNYMQYILSGGHYSLRNYLNGVVESRKGFSCQHAEFDILVKKYYSLFGKGNVLVLPYELLRDRPHVFLNKLAKFSGISRSLSDKVNVERVYSTKNYFFKLNFRFLNRLSNEKFWIVPKKHLRNRVLVRLFSSRFLRFGIVDKLVAKKMEKQIKAYLNDYYFESNKRLEVLIDMNLKEFGYYE